MAQRGNAPYLPCVSTLAHRRAHALPKLFQDWFATRGWTPRAHQLDLLASARAGRSTLLIAPTGAGKTLAGFLPTLVELSEARSADVRARAKAEKKRPAEAADGKPGLPLASLPLVGRVPPPRQSPLHTLYISPLKALAVDIARNLEAPIAEMGLPIRVETRTGDTPASRRQRQRRDPPDILLTTPEQIALLLASKDADYLFSGLKRVVLDELHALVTSKRGDLLALALARLRAIAPGLQSVGLSATVAEPDDLRRYLVSQLPGEPDAKEALADLVIAKGGAAPDLSMLESLAVMPWASHTALHALPEVYALIAAHKTTLVFVNTRWQAEFLFQELWRMNDLNLPIALHHGSLDVEQRRRVEAAMAAGKLKGVVCTSSLDLGI
ncbi:MAG: DEAD/DEAH box helicase, partial [Pseudomonadota bacterium]